MTHHAVKESLYSLGYLISTHEAQTITARLALGYTNVYGITGTPRGDILQHKGLDIAQDDKGRLSVTAVYDAFSATV